MDCCTSSVSSLSLPWPLAFQFAKSATAASRALPDGASFLPPLLTQQCVSPPAWRRFTESSTSVGMVMRTAPAALSTPRVLNPHQSDARCMAATDSANPARIFPILLAECRVHTTVCPLQPTRCRARRASLHVVESCRFPPSLRAPAEAVSVHRRPPAPVCSRRDGRASTPPGFRVARHGPQVSRSDVVENTV